MRIDRSDAQEAQRIFRQLYPENAMLRVAAMRLADSVTVANKEEPGSWSVTLFEDMVRLNVGPVEVCTLVREGIKLVTCVPQSTPLADGLTFDRGDEPAYRSVPIDSAHLYLDGRIGDSIPHDYINAHHAYIKEAAQLRRRSSFRRAFSVGVLLFLEAELELKLPRPIYLNKLDAHQDDLAELEATVEPFDPCDEGDGRERVLANLVRRRGQGEFRRDLLRAYGSRCAITGCAVEDVLEAALGLHSLRHRETGEYIAFLA